MFNLQVDVRVNLATIATSFCYIPQKYLLVCTHKLKFRDMAIWQYLWHGTVDSKTCKYSNVKIY